MADIGCISSFDEITSTTTQLALELGKEVMKDSNLREDHIIYRKKGEKYCVYRWDNRPPKEIFAKGFFPPKTRGSANNYYSLSEFISSGEPYSKKGRPPFGFISTSKQPKSIYEPNKQMYRYEIHSPGGIDVNPTLQDKSLFQHQKEVVFVGGIHRKYIKCGQQINTRPMSQKHKKKTNFDDLQTVLDPIPNPEYCGKSYSQDEDEENDYEDEEGEETMTDQQKRKKNKELKKAEKRRKKESIKEEQNEGKEKA